MCTATSRCDTTPLTFETMLTDPMIRLVMASDGVSVAELTGLLHQARIDLAQRNVIAFNASK